MITNSHKFQHDSSKENHCHVHFYRDITSSQNLNKCQSWRLTSSSPMSNIFWYLWMCAFTSKCPQKDHINSIYFSIWYSECWYVWLLEDLVRGVNDYPLNVWCTLLGKIFFLARWKILYLFWFWIKAYAKRCFAC